MLKILFYRIVFFIIICFPLSFAQAPITEWIKTYNMTEGRGRSVIQTNDGGYLITGAYFLIKTDTNGDTVWTQTYSSGANYGVGYSAQQTTDGGYIITGSYVQTPTIADVWLLKTDSLGETLWTKTFGLASFSEVGHAVQQTNDGGYIITGIMIDPAPSTTGQDLWLIKTDPNGNLLWEENFGGDRLEEGSSVHQTTDGGYVVAGRTNSYSPDQSWDILLIKTNSFGNILWSKIYGGLRHDAAYSIDKTTDGGYIICGFHIPTDLDYDIWILKTDSNGDTLWTKTYGYLGDDWAYSVQQTSDEDYIVAGYGYGAYGCILKLDELGDSLWAKTYDETFFAVQQTSDEGYILTGGSVASGAFLMKLASESLTPAITVTTPNGGEILNSGSNYNIIWTSTNVTNVKIEYTTDNGSSWNTIVASTPSDGEYEWIIPNTLSNNCLVKISDIIYPQYFDESDTVFTISEYDLSLEAYVPYTGEGGNSYYDRTPIIEEDKFLFNVTLQTTDVIDPPLHNLKVEAYIDGVAMDIHLNSNKFILDDDNDELIDSFPNPPGGTSIKFLVSSPGYQQNQIDKLLDIRLTEINGVQTNISYTDMTSLYFAKHSDENRGFDLLTDAYSFDNPASLSFREFLQYFIVEGIPGLMVANFYNAATKNGKCFGMAATSGNYFLHSNLKPLSGSVHSWSSTNFQVNDNINISHIVQSIFNDDRTYDNQTQYDELKNVFANNEPAVLGMKNVENPIGHAILATKLTTLESNNTAYISVYENKKHSLCYTSTLTLNDFTFSHPTFSLPNSYNTFTVFPPSLFTIVSILEIKNWILVHFPINLFNSGLLGFGTACPVHLLVKNSQGQRIGYLNDGTLVNEISGGEIYRAATYESEQDSLTLIYVPANETYTTEMSGYDDGIMLFEYFKAPDSTYINTSSIDSVNVTSTTVCYFDELTPNILSVDYDGDGNIDTTLSVRVEILTDVEEDNLTTVIPTKFSLEQNYPNPFNPTTRIKYSIPEESFISIKIYNTLGEEIAELVNKTKAAGNYEVSFSASNLASGIYLYRLQSGYFVETKKMILMK